MDALHRMRHKHIGYHKLPCSKPSKTKRRIGPPYLSHGTHMKIVKAAHKYCASIKKAMANTGVKNVRPRTRVKRIMPRTGTKGVSTSILQNNAHNAFACGKPCIPVEHRIVRCVSRNLNVET